MSEISIFLDNSANSPDSNPPGYNQWVGGNQHGDPAGIKVVKTDTDLKYTLQSDISYLQTWYYDWGWCSGANIDGPFTDGQKIVLPAVSGVAVGAGCCLPFLRKVKKVEEDEAEKKYEPEKKEDEPEKKEDSAE